GRPRHRPWGRWGRPASPQVTRRVRVWTGGEWRGPGRRTAVDGRAAASRRPPFSPAPRTFSPKPSTRFSTGVEYCAAGEVVLLARRTLDPAGEVGDLVVEAATLGHELADLPV